jgi:hypothetical protein
MSNVRWSPKIADITCGKGIHVSSQHYNINATALSLIMGTQERVAIIGEDKEEYANYAFFFQNIRDNTDHVITLRRRKRIA